MLTTTNKTTDQKILCSVKTAQNTEDSTPRMHRLWYQSSYDRGLIHLLKMWPKIKEAVPDETLDITYGWDLFDRAFSNNPERMLWKERMNKLMEQDGITHHGRVGKDKLRELRKKCGVWAYPTHFEEISCIGALECQNDGVVPCVINLAALSETVQSGAKVDGDVYDPEVREKYLADLIRLSTDEDLWKAEQIKGQKFAKKFDWSLIAKQWEDVWLK